MKRVGVKHNNHVVSMICCNAIQEPKALVLEYVEHGDLLQYLQKNKLFVSVNSNSVCKCVRGNIRCMLQSICNTYLIVDDPNILL